MKRKLHIALIASFALFFVQALMAQLTPKDLGTPLYDGQGKPNATTFLAAPTYNDSVIFTQLPEGMNILTKGSLYTPVSWVSSSLNGFAVNGAYTVESKLSITKSMKNGFNLEMQGMPGKRFHINIDTAAIYNMTYYPSAAKEVLVNNLDNRSMHTYRVSVDATDKAHIYRDGVAVATADVDGLFSATPVTTDIEDVLVDQFFEDLFTQYGPSKPFVTGVATYPQEAAFTADLSGNRGISMSTWAHMGLDTTKANVKVGQSSIWYQNGTTGMLTIKLPVTTGKYKLSYWTKSQTKYMQLKGSIAMDGTGGAILLPVTMMVGDNQNYNQRSFLFDVPLDGDVKIVFHNGWDNKQNPGWASVWFDDLKLVKVDVLPYVRFGKDSEAGVTDMTIGSFTYDMTGAYAPDPTGISESKMQTSNLSATQVGKGMLNVRYTLSNNTPAKIQILDLNGRILTSQPVAASMGGNSISLPVSAMKGVYLLRLIANEKTATVKVVLK
ncbi:MAG: T9SS type A sorting domain-containing protein [Bacteroidales bacterium]